MLAGLNEDLALPLLLRRPRVSEEGPFYRSIERRRVMVTGAGGSIGSELVKQIAASKPSELILVDSSEYALFEINCTLQESGLSCKRTPVIADVRRSMAMSSIFSAAKPDVVFHTAALKHVPLLENDHNLMEAADTNVFGTAIVAELCDTYRAQMVHVSTDKAVNPSSVMGLTKRVAELYVANLAYRKPGFHSAIVRFGNVLGSSGSVVPHFRRQIAQGGPVTITHPDMTRYFMSIGQAVSLMLSAGEMCYEKREGLRLYILDMGKPVRIMDLATQLIEQAGLRPNVDVKIEIIGVRPGEKLEEELAYPWETLSSTATPGVQAARVVKPNGDVRSMLDELKRCLQVRDVESVRKCLLALVPEYTGEGVWR